MMSKISPKVIFWMICGGLAVWTTVLQFVRYFDNEDTPTIVFKKFNESPDDIYPDVTFCLSGQHNIYERAKSYLKENYSLNTFEYFNLLSANKEMWEKVPNASKLGDIEFEDTIPKMQDFIVYYYMTLHDRMSPLYGKPLMDKVLRRTYQLPGLICYTRRFGAFLNRSLVSLESFRLRLTKVSNSHVSIFFHYPGQMLRVLFGMDRSFKTQLKVTKQMMRTSNNYEIKVTQMTVLKRRADAVVPCDRSVDVTDDERFWNEIFNQLSCIPPFYKRFTPKDNQGSENCKTFDDFERTKNLTDPNGHRAKQIAKKEKMLSSFVIPCNQMGIITNVDRKDKKELAIMSNGGAAEKVNNSQEANNEDELILELTYSIDSYMEIKNGKDFGMDSLWSYTGGYIGLFLGYSLFSLLSDGFDGIMLLCKLKRSPNYTNSSPPITSGAE